MCKRTKNVQGNKKCERKQKMFLYALYWPLCPHMVLLLLFMAINMCGLLWPFYGLIWSFMVFHGRISSFLAVIDQNSFGLVF